MKEHNYNIYAGIITFNPNLIRLEDNIKAIIDQVDQIIIVDNNSDNKEQIIKLCLNNSVKIIQLDKNYGIAYALNRLFRHYIINKNDWVLTLDQDSICPSNMISTYKKYIDNNVGIICPTIYDINRNNVIEQDNNVFIEKRCITSGSLTSVKAYYFIDGFDEKMFIDGVDFDFCDRLLNNNFTILRCGDVILKHEIGKITIRKFLWLDVIVRSHSAFRKYYIAKNIIYLDKKNKYHLYPFVTLLREIKLLLIVILYEDDKINKIKRIVYGIIDGFKEKI
jgi:rhamnosyltransferase